MYWLLYHYKSNNFCFLRLLYNYWSCQNKTTINHLLIKETTQKRLKNIDKQEPNNKK